jgi:hypothetical protein
MNNVKSVYENSKSKSLKKGIPVKYKGQIIKLDPVKVAVASFGLTATLVITGVASAKLYNIIKTDIKEGNIVSDYESSVMKDWNESNEFYRVNNNRNYAIDYFDIAKDILTNGDIKLYSFLSRYTKDSNETHELLTQMAFIEDAEYQTLEEYVTYKGFNSIDEWCSYCRSQILENNNTQGRGM